MNAFSPNLGEFLSAHNDLYYADSGCGANCRIYSCAIGYDVDKAGLY